MSKKPTQAIWLLAVLILVVNFVALVVALTDIIPDSELKEYRFLLGITFITIGGFIRNAYKTRFSDH